MNVLRTSIVRGGRLRHGRLNHVRCFVPEVQGFISGLTESVHTIHAYTGIPWWALIPITTFTLRSIWTLPLAIIQRKRIRKQAVLRPIVNATNPVLKLNLARKVNTMKAKQEASLEERRKNGKLNPTVETLMILQAPLANMSYEQIILLAAKETRKRQKTLFKKNGAQLWKNIILPSFQIPLWVCMSLTIRDLSGWTSWDNVSNKALDPSLYNEGLLWFSDLSAADSMHILPMILGVISLCNVEWIFKTLELMQPAKRSLRPTMMQSLSNVSRMSIVFLMAISLHAPVALVLYWISSQLFSLIQNIFLDIAIPISFTPNKRIESKALQIPNDRVPVSNDNHS